MINLSLTNEQVSTIIAALEQECLCIIEAADGDLEEDDLEALKDIEDVMTIISTSI